MKSFAVKFLSVLLCLFLLSPMVIVSASAVAVETVIAALSLITAAGNAISSLANATSSVMQMKSEIKDFLQNSNEDSCNWLATSYSIGAEGNRCETTKDVLAWLVQDWNTNYAAEAGFTVYLTTYSLDDGTTYSVIRCMLDSGGSRGDTSKQLWLLCDGNGRILCSNDTSETDGHWIPYATAMSATSFRYLSREALYNLATDLGMNVMSSKGRYMITDARGQNVYADLNGLPFAAWIDNNTTATGQTRPDTQVKDENGDPATDEEGNIIQENNTDNSTNIDMSGMTITLPDGKILAADQIIYDESQKTYYIDSHDTYNTTTNYYYSWTYYINYTSITYIGQTEEYSKYYEVYYELPDGRDSADLTSEDLEQLNTTIDVIPYARSADDVSLRSLYHFDGDIQDSSYWNYTTDFIWNIGASLTYMESGTFDGCLYLDETDHEFMLVLPSEIGVGDFTLQFRYYQSYTAAPQTDSYIQFGSTTVLQMDGANFKSSDGTVLSKTPIGSWNEVAIIRHNGTIYFYLNGLSIGSISNSGSFNKQILFHFGSSQQTYKQLDELRVLDYALSQNGIAYECTSVPYDTNLSLVLPDEDIPVADEFYDVTFHDGSLYMLDLTNQNVIPSEYLLNTVFQPGINGGFLSTSITSLGYSNVKNGYSITNTPGFRFPFSASSSENYYVHMSVIASDFQVYEVEGALSGSSFIEVSSDYVNIPDGLLVLRKGLCAIIPAPGVYCQIQAIQVYTEKCSSQAEAIARIGTFSNHLTTERITSIIGLDPSSFHTPTLAVRTDLDITSHQIGGVRPSLPKKGQVWAMVESGYITSIQIYNGSAWEACDGRIWTGARWIPASSYNVITLQDMYDIADATPNYEYIYSESGFWSWWQKSWNAFTDRLFGFLGSGSVSGGSSSIAPGSVKDALSQALSSLITSIFGLITEVLKSLIGAAADLISGIFSFLSDAVLGGLKDFFGIFTDGSLLEGFQQTGDDGSTTIGLPDGVSTVFAFFSGFFLLLPVELRSVLFLGMGLLSLLAVFKIVRE